MQMIMPLLLMYRISVNYCTFVKHICYVHKLRVILYVINIIICFLDTPIKYILKSGYQMQQNFRSDAILRLRLVFCMWRKMEQL